MVKGFSYYNQIFCSHVLWVMLNSIIQLSLEGASVEVKLALQPEVAVRSCKWGTCNNFKSYSIVFTFLQRLCCVGSWPYDYNK